MEVDLLKKILKVKNELISTKYFSKKKALVILQRHSFERNLKTSRQTGEKKVQNKQVCWKKHGPITKGKRPKLRAVGQIYSSQRIISYY